MAQEISIAISPPPGLPVGAYNIGTLLSRSVGLILILAALAAFIYLVWGGLTWITSGGDKAKVEESQHRIQAAIIGLFIIFATYAIMLIIGGFFGLNLGNLRLPTLQ